MKKVICKSLIMIKLALFLCFSHLAFFESENVILAKVPCHERGEVAQEYNQDCQACQIAFSAWSEDFVSVSKWFLFSAQAHFIDDFVPESFVKSPLNLTTQVYRPPPKVLWITAFHRPQLVTVLII